MRIKRTQQLEIGTTILCKPTSDEILLNGNFTPGHTYEVIESRVTQYSNYIYKIKCLLTGKITSLNMSTDQFVIVDYSVDQTFLDSL